MTLGIQNPNGPHKFCMHVRLFKAINQVTMLCHSAVVNEAIEDDEGKGDGKGGEWQGTNLNVRRCKGFMVPIDHCMLGQCHGGGCICSTIVYC